QAQVDDELYRLGMGFAESFNFSPLRSTAAVPLMLVGPTGAGKTSCAAKLAALALAEGETAIMITTDVGRAGALEQFATYSEKLNIECYAAETPDEISLIMRETKPQGAVILDTPGISPYDAGDLAALKSYQTAIGAEPVLVLPASGDVGEYTDWAHAFRAFGVRCCIITKFDATRRVGAGLSAAFEGNMTLTYFSETPFISEGLLPASPEYLAYRLTASYPGRIVQA
ncbi:MAG: GTPase, partial [Pseudomonadota bacterium]